VNVLAQNQRAIAKHCARTEKDDDDAPRPGARFTQTEAVTPMLEGCLAYLNSRVVSAQGAGDHTIFVGEAEQVVVREDEPLLFYAGKCRTISAELPREQ
jgi:flavin reductase (DIM6/NTAB) family NADH-FMN oxidoreductase RutF